MKEFPPEPKKLIDPSPFDSNATYMVEGHLLTNLWTYAQRAGNYGLSHDENRGLQNLMSYVSMKIELAAFPAKEE